MRSFIFDTETTGLGPRDEVVQFSGILLNDDDHYKIESVLNFYCETDVPSSEAAMAVHHLDQKILHKLSGGKTFEEQFANVLDFLGQFPDLTWVAYNYSFDQRMCRQTMVNNNAKDPNLPMKEAILQRKGIHAFCCMDMCTSYIGHGRKMKNVEAAHHPDVMRDVYNNYGIEKTLAKKGIRADDTAQMSGVIDKLYSVVMKMATGFLPAAHLHDSLYDSYLTMLVYRTFSGYFRR